MLQPWKDARGGVGAKPDHRSDTHESHRPTKRPKCDLKVIECSSSLDQQASSMMTVGHGDKSYKTYSV